MPQLAGSADAVAGGQKGGLPAGGAEGKRTQDKSHPQPQSGAATPPVAVNGLPMPAGQGAAPEKPEPLKEITRRQIEALLAEKETRTPAQVKMDSALIYLIKWSRGEKIAGAPDLELDVKPDARGLVTVDITATVTPDLLAAIQSGGGSVINQVPSERAVRAMLPVAAMEPLAERKDVQILRTADQATSNLGTVVSEGDRTHRADTARSTFGATGAGVKVGVLSDGVDSLAASVSSGNINSNVTILSGQAGTGDEGTAMLEIVQDLVPGAQLYYATANTSAAQFAQNIRDLAAAGCSVIVDDFTYYSESPFQDATIARAVNDVSALGVMYFSSARNSGSVDKGTAGTWEGDFADGGTTSLGSKAGNVHSFGGGFTYNTVASGGSKRRVDLFWADPLGASSNDYDFFVTDSSGTVLRSSTTTQNGAQDPYETTGTLNVGERIIIVKTSTAASRFIHLDTGRAVISIVTPGNVRGHNASVAANAFSVAAANVANAPAPGVFTGGAANPVESFSSDGPRRMFFNSDGTAITPGNFSSTGGQVFQKPDFTAADGVTTTVPGFTSFFGTSAAAPHAAAIAALIKSSNPALTPAQIRTAMASTALDNEGAGFDRDSGSGIVMAYQALQAVSTPAISSFSPASGLPGASVVISGIGLSTVTSVTFNGVSATFTANSPSQITATVPAGASTGLITVVGPLGTASSPTPFTVFGFSPSIGTPGSSVVLTGSGFTGATAVSFNGTSAASFTVDSATQITAVVPFGATTGTVSVTTPGGVITGSNIFTALTGDGTPTIASFTPSSGSVGSSVTLTGTNYYNVTAIAFNGTPAAAFTVNSQTQLTATVPVPTGGVSGNITVTTGYGTATSATPFTTQTSLATFNSATDVPVTANGFTAGGDLYMFLNFAPVTGTNLTLVNNTALTFISGTYSNLAQGQAVNLSYGGSTYKFVANYYGGTGNDLVLQWAGNRVIGWGLNNYSQVGNNNSTNVVLPTGITTSGVLAGKTISKIAAGGSHTLALCTDGTLVAWGANGSGQLGNNTTITVGEAVLVNTSGALAGKTVTDIAAGGLHSMALCSNGTVVTWGQNFNGQLGNNSTATSLVPVAVYTAGALSGKTVTAIAAGLSHSIVRCSDGTVLSWGLNTNGQLGNNSTAQSTVPVAVTTSGTALSGKSVSAVAAGNSHSLVLCSDGTMAAWGLNSSGQLGNNSTTQSLVAVAVSTTGALSGKSVSSISTTQGAFFNMARCSDGTFVTWGLNLSGQLGIGSTTNSLVPVVPTITGTALAGKTLTGVFAGGTHSLFLCSDGSMAASGADINGQLGNNSTTQSTTAVAVIVTGTPLSGKSVSTLSGGTSHSVALCSDGTVACWGSNFNGQIGNSAYCVPAPVAAVTAGTLLAGKTIVSLSLGGNHSVALCADGTLATWGSNLFGQLGNGTTTTSTLPTAVTTTGVLAGKRVVAVAAGQSHTLVLCSDGTVCSWGYNASGQLGNNSTAQSNVPVAVTTAGTALAGKTVAAIAAGSLSSTTLCTDGTVVSWGSNSNGQLGNNSTTQSNVAVAATTTGTALEGKTVATISVGMQHVLALCSDGTLVSWGFNSNGQLGNNSITQSTVAVPVSTAGLLSGRTVTSIAAGGYHSMALCADGTLATWGYNLYGQLGINTTSVSLVPVAVIPDLGLSGKTVSSVCAGQLYSTALSTDGTAATWGYSGEGELGTASMTLSKLPVSVLTTSFASGERFLQLVCGSSSAHSLALVAGPPTAQIVVQQPAGMNLNNGGSAIDFGSCSVGASTTRTFTLLNNGTAPLTISNITFDGTNGADFSVTTPPASSVAIGGSTTFVVTFTPAAALNRSGVMHIGSNDPVNGSFAVNLSGTGGGNLAATYNSAATVPITATNFTATGSTVNLTLNYTPATGSSLTVVQNTGLNFINGTFDNLTQGQTVTLPYNGSIYSFVANYYGGTGNDLVLQWANSRPVAWGQNIYSQLGNNNASNFLTPTGVFTTGVLAGKSVSKLASGGSHTLVLCSDGTLAAWGYNAFGQLGNGTNTQSMVPVLVTMSGVLSGKSILSIAAGTNHCLVQCTDGTLAAWGNNANGQLGNNSTTSSNVPVAVTITGTALAGKIILGLYGGGSHSLALCSDSTIVAWGYNFYGQLGNNSTTDSKVAVAVVTSGVLSGKIVSNLSAGTNHNLALCNDGTAVSWGSSSSGQLGNNTTTNSSVPVAVTTSGTGLAGRSVSAIAAGGFHSMALCTDGTVTAWGYNFYGQIGNNSTTNSSVAVAVGSYGSLVGKTGAGISAGYYHSLVRCSDGTLSAWGSNSNGQLGNNSTAAQSNVPVLVTTAGTPLAGKTLSTISAGQYHNFAYCTDGTIAGWGNDFNGQLGNNLPQYSSTAVATTTAGTPLAGKTVVSEAAGQYHSLALGSDGTIVAWGNNSSGQLGNGTTTTSPVPTAVSQFGILSGKTVVAVSGGQVHSVALSSDGTVAAWGGNTNGQLGNNSTTTSNTPVAVITSGALTGKTVASVSAGGTHTLALCSDGTMAAWGNNTNGQLGNNSTTQSSVPVAVTTSGILAGKMVVAISAGGNHNLALCSDGTVVSWGNNANGQLGIGSTTQSLVPVAVTTIGSALGGRTVTALSAGGSHSLALCSDGTLAAWGYNFYGQLGNGTTTQSTLPIYVSISGTALAGKTVSSITACNTHSAAFCTDGTMAAWGNDAEGELGNNSTTNSSVAVTVSTSTLSAGEAFVQAVGGQTGYHTLAMVATPPAPQIGVQQPVGTSLASGSSSVDFGTSPTGTGTSQVFTLVNSGAAPLSIAAVTINGTSAVDFAVTSAPATSIPAGGSTTMTVTFTPSAALARSALLHVVSNDPTISSFDVSLTGYGALALAATYTSATTVPLTVPSFQATGSTVSFTLGYAPLVGTSFTVVNNTGIAFIGGNFTNLQQGQSVSMSYGGKTYQFVANYYGGTGNDLVLQWAYSRPMSWGLDSYGQLGNGVMSNFTTPLAVSTAGALAGKSIASVASGFGHTVALCTDGTVVAWGSNTSTQLGNNSTSSSSVPVTVVANGALAGKTVVAVAAGGYHSMALCSDGTIVTWGYNVYGQLGNNSTSNSGIPVAVITSGTALAGKTVVAVAAGYAHSLALCSDGTMAAWGYNTYGQLGNNSTANSSVPVAVTSTGVLAGKTVSAITSGYYHCTALCSDGTMAAWGYNFYGQLGNNSTTSSSVPVAVTSTGVLAGKTVSVLTSGYYYNAVLCSDGTLASWGDNSYGQLGNNSTTNSKVPVAVTTSGTVLAGKTISSVACGYYHSMALCSDGTLAAWGNNTSGQLGNSGFVNSSLALNITTSGVLAGKSVTRMSGGNAHSVVVCSDGTAASWGSNFYGQLGANGPSSFLIPTAMPTTGTPLSGKIIIDYAAGNTHSLAVCSDGTVVAWGYNAYGQLGNNSTANSSAPAAITSSGVLSGKTVVAVSAGNSHSLALCSDGTVASWGSNGFGQLGNNSVSNSSIPVAVSTTGTALAGKTVVAVSAGASHSMALCSDGTVATWGYNFYGQLGNNSTSQSNVPVAVITSGVLAGKTVVALASGAYHSMALCSDGTVATWGYNFYGQLGNNSTTNSSVPVAVTTTGTALAGKTVSALSTGYYHTQALCSDGSVVGWGYNSLGQLGNGGTTNSSVAVAPTTAGTVLAGKTVSSIFSGYYHSLALCTDGTLASWGSNSNGELGNNTLFTSLSPSAVNMSALANGEQFVQLCSGPTANHNLALVAQPIPAPAILVQNNQGNTLANGYASVDFGGLGLGSSASQTFTIGNSGLLDLSISGVTIDGANASDFVITAAPAGTVASGATTTLVVQFAPGGTLGRNAVLHIVSNDPFAASFNVTLTGAGASSIAATYNSAADVPAATAGLNANGSTVNFTLNYAPATGTQLTVINNTGPGLISGSFGNLVHGQQINLSYNGVTYKFVASFYGGTGNDLVLMWAGSRPVAWGYNIYGELGNNSTTDSGLPVAVAIAGTPLANRTLTALTSGYEHSLALCSDGTLAAWGYNFYGQLGNNSTTNSSVPVAVTTAGTALAGKTPAVISAGFEHNLVLCTDGTLAGWGYNANGQLGNNSFTNSSLPVAVITAGTVLAGKSVVAIGTGTYNSMALCSDGTLAAWGYNFYGQLGNGSTTSSNLPVAVTTAGTPLAGKTMVAMAAGGYHSLALCSDGTLAAWGENNYGQIGNNSTTNSSVPVAVTTTGTALAGKTIVAVAAGHYHTLVLCSDGSLASWGNNTYGQLGNNSTTNSSVPVAVTRSGTPLAGRTVVSITAGYYYSMATCSDGTVVSWGYNAYGQLGNNSTTNSSVPVAANTSPLASGESFMLVASGESAHHTLALVASPVPAAATVAATSVLGTTATLNGTVNANGGIPAVSFEYGPDTSYGTTVAASPATVTGYSDTAVSAALAGLLPATTYHFRVNANSSGEAVSGGDQTFTTANVYLSGLVLGSAALSPAFTPSGYAYTSSVDSSVSSTTVTPTTADAGATVTVNGVSVSSGATSSPIPLGYGDNSISIVVTAADQISTLTYSVIVTRAIPNPLPAVYGSSKDIPVNINGYAPAGNSVNFALNYAPVPGTTLMVVNNTGPGFINGTFSNLSHGQAVNLTYNGLSYNFVASYYGGTGNDLVLVWSGTRPVSWGSGFNGQLGSNSSSSKSVPVSVVQSGTPLSNRTILALASGYIHSLALCSDGTLTTWGDNANGELGNNTYISSLQAQAVTITGTPLAGKTVAAISAGYLHNLVLCTDGSLASWGFNSSGQLGNNTTTQSAVAVQVATAGTPLAGRSVTAIGTGTYHCLALCSDGTVHAWGSNSYGQLGDSINNDSSVAVAVTTAGTPLAGKIIVSVAAGGYHNLALCSDGTLVAWGDNEYGQLGNNSLSGSSNKPVAVTTAGTPLAGKKIVAIAAGHYHSMALCSDGTIATWGYNNMGQLGNNSSANSGLPVAVMSSGTPLEGKTVISIAGGYYHCAAACSDGTVVTWGGNTYGQLGNNSTTSSLVPVAVSTSSLAIGESFMLTATGQSSFHNLALVALPPAPAVTTLAATSITGTTVTLNGSANAHGGSAAVSFDYGLDTSYGTNVAASPAAVTGGTDTPVSVALTGLMPATTYHFRANAADSSGTANGTDMTFTTPDTNASLSAITISTGLFTPAFSSSVLTYAVGLPNATSSFSLSATTSSSTSTMTMNGDAQASGATSAPISFSADSATVTFVVMAQDGTTSKTYTLNITRNTVYLDWAAASNLTGSNNAASGDADGDGIPNLLEYAFNSSPTTPGRGSLPTSTTSLNATDGKHYFTYSYRRRTSPGTMTYSIESSATLGSWTAIPLQNLQQVGSAVGAGDGVTEIVTFRILPALEDSPAANFIRLKVTP